MKVIRIVMQEEIQMGTLLQISIRLLNLSPNLLMHVGKKFFLLTPANVSKERPKCTQILLLIRISMFPLSKLKGVEGKKSPQFVLSYALHLNCENSSRISEIGVIIPGVSYP